MQALGRVIETAGPITRQKTFARTPGDGVEARLVIEKSLLRGFGAVREICELLLSARGGLQDRVDAFES